MRRSVLALALVSGMGMLPLAANAQQATPPTLNPPPADLFVIRLQAEKWVETKTAKVVATVTQAQSGEAAAKEQSRVPGALKELAKDVEWQVTGFDRTRDDSGLERWSITAEGRLPESALGGIYDRARALGRPGRQVEIQSVEFTPTVAEREATASSLRAELYQRALEEAKRITDMNGRPFRVHRVNVAIGAEAPPALAETRAEPVADDGGSGVDGVANRMMATASVVLASPGK